MNDPYAAVRTAMAAEDRIERLVEIKFDRLDREYTTTAMTEEQYRSCCAEIDRWAEWEYAAIAA